MQRYYFSITNEPPFNDIDGLELPDLGAARTEAIGLARDLMRHSLHPRGWSHGAIRVTDDSQRLVLNLPFAEAKYP
jgi:hypothetical protein